MSYLGNTPGIATYRVTTSFTASAGQTTFAPGGGGYAYVDVYLNGAKLRDQSDFTATDGRNIVLTFSASEGDEVDIVTYRAQGLSARTVQAYTETATAGQTEFTCANGTHALAVYMNGIRLIENDDYTLSGNILTLTVAALVGDILEFVTHSLFSVTDAYTKTESDARYVKIADLIRNWNVIGRGIYYPIEIISQTLPVYGRTLTTNISTATNGTFTVEGRAGNVTV